ncbi:MAG: hypothetical protein IKM85_01560 [Bacteroidales bacterium]|nr:hypothetical protein [Bacteroidales bacterium]
MSLRVKYLKFMKVRVPVMVVTYAVPTQLRGVAETAHHTMVLSAQMEVDAQTMSDQQHLKCHHKGHYLK